MEYSKYATAVAVMLLAYLLGAFIGADFNIANWNPVGRTMVGIGGLAAGLLSMAEP